MAQFPPWQLRGLYKLLHFLELITSLGNFQGRGPLGTQSHRGGFSWHTSLTSAFLPSNWRMPSPIGPVAHFTASAVPRIPWRNFLHSMDTLETPGGYSVRNGVRENSPLKGNLARFPLHVLWSLSEWSQHSSQWRILATKGFLLGDVQLWLFSRALNVLAVGSDFGSPDALTGNIKAPASLGACHFPRKHPGKRTSESSSFPPGRILPPVSATSHIAWRNHCHLEFHCFHRTPSISQQASLEETLLFHHFLGKHTRPRSVVHRIGS